MRRSALVLALLAGAVPPVALAQGTAAGASGRPPEGPPRQVVSKWRVVRDAAGREVGRALVNRRLDFAFRYIAGQPTDLLLVEEVRLREQRGVEGGDNRVRVEAWASARPDTGFRTRLWVAELEGERVELREDYVDVTTSGCCGAQDAHTYLSLTTGRRVAVFTDGPHTIQGGDVGLASSQAPVWVAFLSASGAAGTPELARDTSAIGELLFVEGDSVRSRVLLSATDPGVRLEVDNASVELTLVADGEAPSSYGVSLRDGQRAAARLAGDDGSAVLVPIRGRAFALAGAALPKGVRATLLR